MSATTSNLGLFKYDPITDADVPFSIEQAMNDNWDKIDSSVVKKSGDTMTGNLNVSTASTSQVILKRTDMDRSVNPSSNAGVMYYAFKDKNDLDFGNVGIERYTDGKNCIKLQVYNKTGSGAPAIRLYATPDGDTYWTGPRSDLIDGQWTYLGQDILSGASLTNASGTDLIKTVNVPNDRKIYEIMVRGRVTTGSTSGNLIRLQITTNANGGGVFICSAITRASVTDSAQGTVITYIQGGSNNINITRASNFTGTADLHVIAYRRVGTNS